MRITSGKFYNRTTSDVFDVELHANKTQINVYMSVDNVTVVDPVAIGQLKITSRLGNAPRSIYFPCGSKFETDDNDAIDRWQSSLSMNGSQHLLYRLETHLRYVFTALIVVLAIGWTGFQYGIPAVSRIVANNLSDVIVESIADNALSFLDNKVFTASALSKSRQQEIKSLFQKNFEEEIEELSLKFNIRGGQHVGANAFALPSGDLIFTDELINLSIADEELISIMAHEVGHIKYQHSLRRIVQGSFLLVMVTMITGDASSIVAGAPTLLLELAYSREFEREADIYSKQFLVSNNIALIHFSNIMRRMQIQKSDYDMGGPENNWLRNYFSTHPDTEERLELFK